MKSFYSVLFLALAVASFGATTTRFPIWQSDTNGNLLTPTNTTLTIWSNLSVGRVISGDGSGITNLPSASLPSNVATNINPFMFGGIGDGIHDDTLSMQACFTNANASANPVVVDLLSRTWLLNGSLVSTNSHFRIQNGTIYVTNPVVNPAIWLASDYATMQHIRLYGPGTNGYSGAGSNQCGVYLGGWTNGSAPAVLTAEVIECDVRNFSTNVFGNHPVMGRIIDSQILCPGNTAIDVNCDQFVIDGCGIGLAGPPGTTVYGITSPGPGPGANVNVWSNSFGIVARAGISLIVRHSNINGVHQVLYANGINSIEYSHNNSELLVNGTTNAPIILLTNIFMGLIQQNLFQPNVGGTNAVQMIPFEIDNCSNGRFRIQNVVLGGTFGPLMSVFGGDGQAKTPKAMDIPYGARIVIHAAYGDTGTTYTNVLSPDVLNFPDFLGGAYIDGSLFGFGPIVIGQDIDRTRSEEYDFAGTHWLSGPNGVGLSAPNNGIWLMASGTTVTTTNLVANAIKDSNLTASQFVASDSGLNLISTLNGSTLTSLTAANVTGSHTLPDGVLSANVPLLNAANAFTGSSNSFVNLGAVGETIYGDQNLTNYIQESNSGLLATNTGSGNWIKAANGRITVGPTNGAATVTLDAVSSNIIAQGSIISTNGFFTQYRSSDGTTRWHTDVSGNITSDQGSISSKFQMTCSTDGGNRIGFAFNGRGGISATADGTFQLYKNDAASGASLLAGSFTATNTVTATNSFASYGASNGSATCLNSSTTAITNKLTVNCQVLFTVATGTIGIFNNGGTYLGGQTSVSETGTWILQPGGYITNTASSLTVNAVGAF